MLAQAAAALESRGEAELIIGLALQRPRAWLIAHDDARLEDPDVERIDALVRKRAAGIPFAHLSGAREFYGREFRVGPAVLIPRPETEHLVEWALALELPDNARVADVGTGSGCIILTLAAERPGWQCTGTDLSAEALAVAADNRARFKLEGATLLQGDLLSPLDARTFDLIVSNPPYVAADDPHLEQGDVRFEPDIALTAGADGLALIRALIERSRHLLAPGGWLLIEHGYDQAEAVRELFCKNGYESVESKSDLAGIERVTGGKIRSTPP
ncbi:MAG: peptide chain release factor N(5)-glutamine methyltransferase [Wenzhouxiangellaceae bacterium]|nr:peptide chain release factor N(5)-glutamine methyltransferase [Wenzhouxiangellaceae bacterium]